MKFYSKISALGAALLLTTAFASADTLTLVSFGSTGSTPAGANNTALSYGGANTYNLSDGGVWHTAVNDYGIQSSWVSYNPGTGPTGSVVAPNGTYTYTTTFADVIGNSYSGTLNVMADDTVDVYLNSISPANLIVGDSIGSSNDDKCESSMPDCTSVDTVTYSFTGTGSDTLIFVVDQVGLAATGVDFDAQFTGTTPRSTSPVPEPSTLLMLGTGLIGAAGALRRRLAR